MKSFSPDNSQSNGGTNITSPKFKSVSTQSSLIRRLKLPLQLHPKLPQQPQYRQNLETTGSSSLQKVKSFLLLQGSAIFLFKKQEEDLLREEDFQAGYLGNCSGPPGPKLRRREDGNSSSSSVHLDNILRILPGPLSRCTGSL
ncbi:hypothetical protein SLA2020_277240 [Shorea laevis]